MVSIPATSSSLVTRKPIVFWIAKPRTSATTKEYTSTPTAGDGLGDELTEVTTGEQTRVDGEEPEVHGSDHAGDQVDSDNVQGVVVAELVFQVDRGLQELLQPPRIKAKIGVTLAQAGVMATKPDTAPDAAPTEVGLPSLIFSMNSQPRIAAAVAPKSVDRDQTGVTHSVERFSADVEAEPSEPQDGSTEHHQRDVVGLVSTLFKDHPAARERWQARALLPGVDVHRGSTGVVDNLGQTHGVTQAHDPAVAPHPGRDREVHHGAQIPAKSIHAPNFARSAIAPEIKAVVIMAKVAPNATPMRSSLDPTMPERPKSLNGFPAKAQVLSTADML
jgi:hypothetical protein